VPSRSGSGRHAAPRRRSRDASNRRRLRLIPSPAVLGVAALGLAGTAVFVAPDSLTDPTSEVRSAVVDRSTADAAISGTYLDRRNQPQVSRSIDRKVLDRQAAQQAQQRAKALKALSAESEKHANKLQKAKEKRIERRQARQWVLPVAGYRITATFGQSSGLWATVHTGLDFAAASGTQVVSVARGTVTSTGFDGAYGNKTVVELEDGTEVWYCHQSSITVSPGEQVDPGETIGAVGATGNVTGPHLHLEVRPGGGEPVDPSTVLQEHNVAP